MSVAQGMEEKVMDYSVEMLISRTKELKGALEQFLQKIDHEHTTLTWPSVLDSFALLSSQMSSLFSLLKAEKIAPLQNYPVIPLRLGRDEDQYLAGLTEGRLTSFNHDIVPNYLRTKPDPEVEQADRQMTQEASVSNDTSVKTLNKHCDRMLEKIEESVKMLRNDQLRNIKQTFNNADTVQLIAVANYGRVINLPAQQLPPGGGKMPSSMNVKMQPMPYSKP